MIISTIRVSNHFNPSIVLIFIPLWSFLIIQHFPCFFTEPFFNPTTMVSIKIPFFFSPTLIYFSPFYFLSLCFIIFNSIPLFLVTRSSLYLRYIYTFCYTDRLSTPHIGYLFHFFLAYSLFSSPFTFQLPSFINHVISSNRTLGSK
jgi:hypothetical protein